MTRPYFKTVFQDVLLTKVVSGKNTRDKSQATWTNTGQLLVMENQHMQLIDPTQVNRMSRSRRMLATGGKQRIWGLDMVCIETILFHLDSL